MHILAHALRAGEVTVLEREKYLVTESHDEDDLYSLMKHYSFSATIMRLKQSHPIATLRGMDFDGILMVLSRSSDERVMDTMFKNGADFVQRAVGEGHTVTNMRLVVAQLRALEQHRIRQYKQVFAADGYEINPFERTVIFDNKPVQLTGKEFGIFEQVLLRNGEVHKRVIYENIYPPDCETEMKTVDVLLCKVRHKCMAAWGFNPILTCWGGGLKLNTERADGLYA